MNYLLNLCLHADLVRRLEAMREDATYNEIERGYLDYWCGLLAHNTTLEQDYCMLRCLPYNPLLKNLVLLVNSELRETRPDETEAGIPILLFLQSS